MKKSNYWCLMFASLPIGATGYVPPIWSGNHSSHSDFSSFPFF
jgi:hypothetical protein